MASIVVAGDTSGTVTLTAPAVSGTTTLTLPTANGTIITTATGQTLTNPNISGQLNLPTWTTATRPSSPVTGTEGYNTTTLQIEVYNATYGTWNTAGTAGNNYSVEYLVIAGGGGGGRGRDLLLEVVVQLHIKHQAELADLAVAVQDKLLEVIQI